MLSVPKRQRRRTPMSEELTTAPPSEESDCTRSVTEGDPELDDATASAEPIPDSELAAVQAALDAGDDDAIERALAELGPESFLTPGGGWGGSQAPVERCILIGRRNGLRVTSLKRSWGNTGSDHHKSQRRSYAADQAGSSSAMDRTARQIAAAVGRPGWTGGYLTVKSGTIRLQLIWKAPDHYDHVHVGCRRD